VGIHLHQPIERVAGAMLQRHLDAHLQIPSQAAMTRIAAWCLRCEYHPASGPASVLSRDS
jgi:hypothetical protein